MPLLPQPSTRSPGTLQLMYRVGAIDHVSGTRLMASVDISDVATLRTEAEGFADRWAAQVSNITEITSWRVLDPSGVSLYEESFGTSKTGSRTPTSNEISAQSASVTLTGKGRPPVGQQQGQTRVVWFTGFFDVVNWQDARVPLDAGAINLESVRSFLTDSDTVGADFYGVKADWRNYFTPQINSHYQKKYGL